MAVESLELWEQLTARRERIVGRWLEGTLRVRPGLHPAFLLQERDPFRNPAGFRLRTGLDALFGSLSNPGETPDSTAVIQDLIRLRAVQDLSASQAVSFLFLLKDIVRQECPDLGPGSLTAIDRAIDQWALKAFDAYAESREKLHAIRAREARRRLYLLERLHPEFTPALDPLRGDPS